MRLSEASSARAGLVALCTAAAASSLLLLRVGGAAAPSGDFCQQQVFHQKLSDVCAAQVPSLLDRVPCVRFLFVSGCGYSGTHFVSHAFNLNVQDVTASHEHSMYRTDIDVSWYGRYDVPWAFADGAAGGGNNEVYRASDMGNFFQAGFGPQVASRECLYAALAHQVRHPLKVFASLMHHTSAAPVEAETVNPNRAVWGHIMARSTAAVPLEEWHIGNFIHEPLKRGIERAMLHWLSWNQMLEEVADFRYRLEDEFDAVDICQRAANIARANSAAMNAGLTVPDCKAALSPDSLESRVAQGVLKFSHQGNKREMTWSLLDSVNSTLSAKVWEMAQRYGYDRQPPVRQSAPTHNDSFDDIVTKTKAVYQSKQFKHMMSGGMKRKDHTGAALLERYKRVAESLQETLSQRDASEV